MIGNDDRAIARAMQLFVRHCAIREGDRPDVVIARALEVWRSALSRSGASATLVWMSPAFEIAWLLLDDASLAPREAQDDEERTLIDRLRLFMALVPERDAWLDYLAEHPRADALAGWRARRAARARLLFGAVHPDDATLASPAAPHARFVSGHVEGPVVCFECMRRHGRVVRVAAAGGEALVEARVALGDRRGGSPIEVVVRVIDDAGWLRARIDPIDPAMAPSGRWGITLHADDQVVEGTVELPTGWRGHNLGALGPGGRPTFHRIELARLDGGA